MVHARNKGKTAETEFINKFQSLFPDEIKRNLDQSRDGGSDVTGCEPFVIEIKRVEKLDFKSWWRQVKRASLKNSIPLVAYRQSRQPWRFLMPATLIVSKSENFIIADEETFIKFVAEHYDGES